MAPRGSTTLRWLLVGTGLVYGAACGLRTYQVGVSATDWIPVLIFGPATGVVVWLVARGAPTFRPLFDSQLPSVVVVAWVVVLAGLLFLLFANTMVNGGTVLLTGVQLLAVAFVLGPVWPGRATEDSM